MLWSVIHSDYCIVIFFVSLYPGMNRKPYLVAQADRINEPIIKRKSFIPYNKWTHLPQTPVHIIYEYVLT